MVPHRYSLRHRVGFLWTKGIIYQSLRLLVFFLISITLWVLVTLNRSHETQFSFPIKIANIPQNVELSTPLPTSLEVTSRGSGVDLLLAHLKREKDTFPLFFQSTTNSEVLLTEDYLPAIRQRFRALSPAGIEVIRISPDQFYIDFEVRRQKRVPLQNKLQYSFPPGYQLASESIAPDSVTLMGSEHLLDSIQIWHTIAQEVTIGKGKKAFQIAMDTLSGLSIIPNHAHVQVQPRAYTQKDLTLWLNITDLPDDFQVNLSPPKLKLTCVVPLDTFDEVAEQYTLDIPFHTLDQEIPYFVPKVALALPASVKVISRSPLQITYVIVNKVQ